MRVRRLADQQFRTSPLPIFARNDLGCRLHCHYAPRHFPAAHRHEMQVYADPKLLNVRGALDVLPTLSLNADPTQPALMVRRLHQGLHQIGANRDNRGES